MAGSAYRIKNIWLEQPARGTSHTASAGAGFDASRLTDSDVSFTANGDTDWRVSTFDGVQSGQTMEVSSADSDGNITLGTALSGTPDSTTKFRVWNQVDQVYTWQLLSAIGFDAKDWPNTMYLKNRYAGSVGMRFRIQFIGEPQELVADSGSTVVPRKYIQHYALGKLMGQQTYDNRRDRERWSAASALQSGLAQQYKAEHSFNLPDQTLWQEEDFSLGSGSGEQADPLNGWGS